MHIRLAIVSHQPLSVLGGVPIHLKQLVEALVKIGVDVEVIAPASKSDVFGQITSYPFQVKPIFLQSKLQTMKTMEFSYKVYRYLLENRGKFDAVHGSQWSMFFPCIKRREIDLPMITKFHGTFMFGTLLRSMLYGMHGLLYDLGSFLVMPLYNHIESEVAGKSNGLIFINKSVKKEVEAITYGKYCKNTRIIYNGVNFKKFKPLNMLSRLRHKYDFSERDKILLFVGRLEPLKGIHKLIRVARKLIHDYPFLKILIVGQGDASYMEYLMNLAKPKNNFIFTGWISHDKLPEIYSLADIFVSPSPYSSGNNLLEAMACGKPVVAVKGLGFEELIQHGKTGFIINSSNIEDNLEKLLKAILFDEKLLNYVGRNACDFIKNNLSWEKTALETARFIQLLL